MNEQELLAGLHAIRLERTTYPDVAEVHRHVLAIPIEQIPQKRSWPSLFPSWGSRSMFSALKFIAAGVIVALFGGFLLAGVLTTQQGDETAPAAVIESPAPEVTNETTEPPTTSVRTDILPGVALTVDEVEPGVFRVVDDGVRDLASKNNLDIVAGHDGGIWLQRPQRFVRLGGDEWLAWPNKKHGALIGVAPDSTVWAVSGDHLYSVGGGSDDWTRAKGPAGGFSNVLIKGPAFWVTSDGRVWAKWWDPAPDTKVIGYLGADGWQPVAEWPGKPWSKFEVLLVSDRGDIWHGGDGLQHFVDGAWRTYDGVPPIAWGAAVGADGTFWGAGGEDFVRFDGTQWMTFASPDWVPDVRKRPSPTTHTIRVAPDGSVWVGPTRTDGGTRGDTRRPCRGVGHFDGVTWGRYLPDLCVEAMDVAADGSVWLLASGDDTDDSLLNHLYVITPEELGGVSGAVVAQDEPADPIEPVVVTGTISFFVEVRGRHEAPVAFLGADVDRGIEVGVSEVILLHPSQA